MAPASKERGLQMCLEHPLSTMNSEQRESPERWEKVLAILRAPVPAKFFCLGFDMEYEICWLILLIECWFGEVEQNKADVSERVKNNIFGNFKLEDFPCGG